MRFLIDEDLPQSLTRTFRQYGYEAFHVRDVGLRGAADEEIAAYAKSNELCLISGDLGFADVRTYPPGNHPGIVILRVPIVTGSAQIHQLIEEWLASQRVEESKGCLTILEPGRIRIRRKDSP